MFCTQIEEGYDYFYIDLGLCNGNFSELIAWTGTMQAGTTYKVIAGRVRLVFFSDEVETFSGFKIRVFAGDVRF